MRIHSGDMVQVMAGKDKGKKGKVLATHDSDNRLVVEGVNIATCHIKKQGNTPGQIIKVGKPIQVSNVMILDPESGKPTRIGFQDGRNQKGSCSKKSGKPSSSHLIIFNIMSFKEHYNTVILPQVQKALGIENPMEAPKIEKIVLNMGIGSYVASGHKDFSSLKNDLSSY